MPTSSEPRPSARAVARWLFLTFVPFYVLCSGGHVYTPDGVVMLEVTRSLLEERALSIPPLADWPVFGGQEFEDPESGETRIRAKYGLGLSLAAIPGYMVGKTLAPLALASEQGIFDARRYQRRPDAAAGDPPRPSFYRNPMRNVRYDVSAGAFRSAFAACVASWTNAVVVALTLVLLFLLALELGLGVRVSLAGAVVAGLCTPLWHYAKTFFSEPLAGLGLIGFLYFSTVARRSAPATRTWLFAGLALGTTILAKPVHLVFLVPAALLVAMHLSRRPRREILRDAAAVSAGVLACLALVALYNLARFGTPLETGYGAEVGRWSTPFFEGLFGLLLSPGRGLAFYFPVVLLSLAGAVGLGRAHRGELTFIALATLLLCCVYSRWHMWEGGWCWGPRFLVPVVPLLMLPAIAALDRVRGGSLATRAGALLVVAAGFCVSLGGVLVNYGDYARWLQQHVLANEIWFQARGATGYYDIMRWDWSYAPLLSYWDFPIKDFFLLPHAIRTPGLVLLLLAAAFILTCVGTTQLARAVRGSG